MQWMEWLQLSSLNKILTYNIVFASIITGNCNMTTVIYNWTQGKLRTISFEAWCLFTLRKPTDWNWRQPIIVLSITDELLYKYLQVHLPSMHLLSMLWYDYAGLNVMYIEYSVVSKIKFINLYYHCLTILRWFLIRTSVNL